MTKRAHPIQDTETQNRLLRSLDGIDGRGDGRRDADGVWLADAFNVRERKVGYPGGRQGRKGKEAPALWWETADGDSATTTGLTCGRRGN